jgi:uncharacterized protein (DUF2147 family)
MHKAKIIIAALVTCVAYVANGQSAAQNINGNWRTNSGRALIAIAPCSAGTAVVCGRISRFLVPEPAGGARDENNPNRALRSRPLLGVQVLTNLRWSDGAWRGTGYSPEDGRTFNATVRIDGGQLNVRGCVTVFCRTVEWTRAR